MTEIKRLKELVEIKARQYGNFILSSKLKTNHYFDLKQVLSDPEGVTLIGERIFDSIIRDDIEAIGGYGVGGRLIVAAVVTISYFKGNPISGFEVVAKKELKEDDPQRYETGEYVIKGHFPPVGGKVAIVDDVISTGKAIFLATEVVEQKGRKVAKVRTILDRLLGGSEELRKKGYDFRSLLRTDSVGNVYIN